MDNRQEPNNQEPRKHLSSAERRAMYEAHASAKANKSRQLQKRKKTRRILLAGGGIVLLVGTVILLLVLNAKVWKPARAYAAAEDLYGAGKYMEAYRAFTDLGAYSDSTARAKDCILQNARVLTGRDNAVISTQAEMPWFSIDDAGILAFDKDVYRGDGHLVIPDIFENRAVLGLKEKSFFYADFLLSVEIPGTVESIGDRTFFSCTNLKELVLPDSVSSIGPSAFAQCTALETITLSRRLRTLDNAAFLGCSALKEIVLPEGLEAIAPRTFNNCAALERVSLPSTLKSIGGYAFTGCENIHSVTYNGPRAAFDALCEGDDGAPLRAAVDIICK